MASNTVYVQGSYVDVHDNEVVNLSVDKAGQVTVGEGQAVKTVETVEIPDVLANSKLWEKVVDAGLVDGNGQPTVSRPEAALMADMMAERLGIAHKWKLFETLWHRNNMRGDYNTALNQRKSIAFQEKIKKLLS
jgi:hypothetical protein